MPTTFPLAGSVAPLDQRLAPETASLILLGLSRRRIAKVPGVDDETVAKSLAASTPRLQGRSNRRIRGLPGSASARLQARSREVRDMSGGFAEIDGSLCVHPEVRRGPESRPEPERHLCGQGAPFVGDPVHDLDITPQVVGQGLLTQPERNEELFPEDLPGSSGLAAAESIRLLMPRMSVVVPDVDVRRARGAPAEDDLRLVVDPDAVEAFQVPSQRLEPVARTPLPARFSLRALEKVRGRPVSGSPPRWWRRGESNPRPKRPYVEILHAQSRLVFSSPRFRVGTARRGDQPETSRTSPSGGGLRSQPGFLNRIPERSRLALRVPSRLKPRERVRCRWQLNFAVVFTSQTACSACSSIARCPVETGSPP
jgi:hypothetical protein